MGKIINKERKSIKAAAKSQVAEILAVEDTAQHKALLEEAFEEAKTQINDLESALEQATEEKDKLVDDVEALKAEKEELENSTSKSDSEKDDLKKALDEANKQIEELTKKIEDMEKDAAMNLRIGDLDKLGLLSKGKAADKQKAKVRDMTEEEYADYKDELLELRKGWEESVKKDTPEEKNTDNKPTETDSSGETDTTEDDVETAGEAEETDDGEEVKITAAKLRELRRASAALNKPTEGTNVDEYGVDLDLKAKYGQLWESEEDK